MVFINISVCLNSDVNRDYLWFQTDKNNRSWFRPNEKDTIKGFFICLLKVLCVYAIANHTENICTPESYNLYNVRVFTDIRLDQGFLHFS